MTDSSAETGFIIADLFLIFGKLQFIWRMEKVKDWTEQNIMKIEHFNQILYMVEDI